MTPRFSLAALMAFVIMAGVAFANLRCSTKLWASVVFSLTLTILLISGFGAIAHRGAARLTWAGFALFGWAYFLAVFGSWADLNGVTVPPLITTRLLEQVGPNVLGNEYGPSVAGEPDVVVAGVTVKSAWQFRRIGHCFSALVFGLIGAGVGRTFAAKSDVP
jgi:hypothetical protein